MLWRGDGSAPGVGHAYLLGALHAGKARWPVLPGPVAALLYNVEFVVCHQCYGV